MKKTSCLSFIFFLSVALMLSGCTGSGEKPVPPDVYGDSSSSVFTKVLPSAPASVCPSGGIQVNAGFDRNGNNELDDSEVASSQYVCHGTEGLSSLVGVSGEEAGENCVYGGKKVSVGPDANRNGVLDGDEITSSNYLCNASHGDNGRDGRNSLLKIASESPGTNCPTGGVRIISGLDANGNGALDPGEEGAQSYVCNGFEGNGANAGISAPIGVVAAGADGKVVLTWNANPADGITSFNIYWSTDADGTKADAARISGAASPYTVTGLANGTKYYFFVAGVTVLGEGPASWPVSAIPGTPPVAPTDVTATAGTGKNTITWTASTDALYYRLYRSLSTGVTATGSNSAWGSMPDNTTVIDSNVANGTTYYYIVTAVNDYGESAPSAEVSAIPVGPPPAPAGFIATPGDRRIELSWNASPGAASYKIYSDNGNSLIASPTGTSHTVTGLINGHNYCYQIEAANAVGASMMTYACASPNVAPTAPTGVAAVAGDGQVVVSWSTIPGITQYYLYWSPSSGVTKSSANRISVYAWSGGGTYTHTGRSNGTTYYYVVTSANSFEGAESVEVTATPLPGKTAPTTQKAGNVTDASATLSGVFTNPSGYTTLAWLEYGTSTAYGNTAAQAGYAYSGSISLEVLLSDLMEDTAYHYRIVTQNPAGTFYGNDRTFTTLKAPIVVYPEYVSVIASDGTNLYWGGGGMLYSEPISGGTPSTTLATGFGSDRIAVDEANVYTSDSATIRKIGSFAETGPLLEGYM